MGKGSVGRSSRALLGLLATVVDLTVISPSIGAQSLTSGAVSGAVLDQAGAGITGAMVTITDATSGANQIAEVIAGGRFRFSFLPAGDYQIFAEQVGYRPTLMRAVRVQAASETRVGLRLREDSLPVSRIDTVWSGGTSFATNPGAEYALPRSLVQRFPDEAYGLGWFGELTSATDGDWGLAGLPASATGFALDGVSYDIARSPSLPPSPWVGPALALAGFEEVSALTAPLDVEWGGFGGGVFNGRGRRGTRDVSVDLFGDWSPDVGSSKFFAPAPLKHQSEFGGLVVAGPLLRDTADFAIGVEGEKLEVPQAALWSGAGDSAVVAAARSSLGVPLDDYLAARVVGRERESAFGRFNWRVASGQLLNVWVNGGRFRMDEPVVGARGAPGPGSRAQGTDVVAGASLVSQFGESVANELRLGVQRSRREYTEGELPGTFFVSGHAAGTDPTLPGGFTRIGAGLTDALHGAIGPHHVKLGVSANIAAYDQTYTFGAAGTFQFSDAAGLAAGRGAYYRLSGPPPVARFTVPQLGGFLQDRWDLAPGFAFLIGLRYDGQILPVSKLTRDQAWLAQTGIASDSLLPRFIRQWSSRVGFDWRAGPAQAWQVRGGVGVYYDHVDPGLLAELITQSGRNTVHRGAGALGTWPQPPDAAAAPDVGAVLSMVGPSFEAPRSLKGSLGVGGRLGRSGVIEVSGTVRHTDFLPRRHDLNRLPGRAGQDQYGRPIYGQLVKEAGIVVTDPLTPRRFSGFELVSALDADGYSDYWGVTLRLAKPLSRWVGLYASYTYSHTSDNWLSGGYGGPYGQLTPFPDSLNGADWARGNSDFDIPHRVAAGIELAPFGSRKFTLAAWYRWQSGAPFTPGFSPGVDANGDGSATNDPAFVDDTLPGMAEVIAAWDCLRTQAGRFAERNSCRDPGVGSLGLRLGLSPVRIAGYPVELWAQAFNVLEPELAVWDHALHLADPGTALTVDQTTGRVTVPLVVNANFGRRLTLRTPGRLLRIGLRVNY